MNDLLEKKDDVLTKPSVLSLADAIREGSRFTEQAFNEFGDCETKACALSAALISLQARI